MLPDFLELILLYTFCLWSLNTEEFVLSLFSSGLAPSELQIRL